MQGEGFLFLAVMVLIFVVWVATGGPSRPISFAGPFITPITNVGVTQTGYGSMSVHKGVVNISSGQGSSHVATAPTSVSNLQSQFNVLSTEVANTVTFGDPSPYRGLVTIGPGNTSATDPKQEYVTLRASSSAGQNISITGWRLVSGASNFGATIGAGVELPRSGNINSEGPIVLRPGDAADIVTGESPVGYSFKENMCIGYLAQHQVFYPSLSLSCPAPIDEFNHYYAGNKLNDDACYRLMQNSQRCSTPDDPSSLSTYCLRIIDNQLTYNGCVATHQYDSKFTSTNWRIYLGRPAVDRSHQGADQYGELWKSSRDAIKLLDQNGKTVALYTY